MPTSILSVCILSIYILGKEIKEFPTLKYLMNHLEIIFLIIHIIFYEVCVFFLGFIKKTVENWF